MTRVTLKRIIELRDHFETLAEEAVGTDRFAGLANAHIVCATTARLMTGDARSETSQWLASEALKEVTPLLNARP